MNNFFIESNNRLLKGDETFRQRWSIEPFMNKSLDIVFNWSYDRNPSNKNFQNSPVLVIKDWIKAYSWLKLKV